MSIGSVEQAQQAQAQDQSKSPWVSRVRFGAHKTDLARRDLATFAKLAWDVIEPGTPLIPNWHIGAICTHLQAITERSIRKLIINIPPGHMKSSLVSVIWPAWEWLNNPSEQSLFGSYDIHLAIRDSVKCRDIITSDWYRDSFEPDWKLKPDQNEKGYYVNTKFGNRYTFGLNAGGVLGWRGRKIVIDDPLAAKYRNDPRIKAGVIEVYDKTLSTRVNDISTASFILIMQRLAEDDLSGHLMSDPTYEKLILPSFYDRSRPCTTSIGWHDPRMDEADRFDRGGLDEEDEPDWDLLFKVKFPRDGLEYLETKLGPVDFSGQYQQSPAPAEGNRFKVAWIRRWRDYGSGLIELIHKEPGIEPELVRLEKCWSFISADFACSENKIADQTAFGVWLVTPRYHMVLMDAFAGRIEEPDIVAKAEEFYKTKPNLRQPPIALVGEGNGLGKPILQAMRRKGIPVVEVFAHQDKLVRSATAAIRMQAGQIFLPEDEKLHSYMEGKEGLKNQLFYFPGAAHDDWVDMISLAAEGVYVTGVAGLGGAAAVETVQKSALRIMRMDDHGGKGGVDGMGSSVNGRGLFGRDRVAMGED